MTKRVNIALDPFTPKSYGIGVLAVSKFEADFKTRLNQIILSRRSIDLDLFKDFLPIPDISISEATN